MTRVSVRSRRGSPLSRSWIALGPLGRWVGLILVRVILLLMLLLLVLMMVIMVLLLLLLLLMILLPLTLWDATTSPI